MRWSFGRRDSKSTASVMLFHVALRLNFGQCDIVAVYAAIPRVVREAGHATRNRVDFTFSLLSLVDFRSG